MFKSAVAFASSALTLALFAPEFVAMLKPAAPPARAVAVQPPPAPRASPLESRFREKRLAADAGGQYSVDALIAGQPVKMLVDTGATMVVISAEMADRLGLGAEGRKWRVHTANGDSVATETLLPNIDLGGVYMNDVPALIADRSAGQVNLLGASFLMRLSSVEQRAGVLTLRQ